MFSLLKLREAATPFSVFKTKKKRQKKICGFPQLDVGMNDGKDLNYTDLWQFSLISLPSNYMVLVIWWQLRTWCARIKENRSFLKKVRLLSI